MVTKNYDKAEESFPHLILAIKNKLQYNSCIRTKLPLQEI